MDKLVKLIEDKQLGEYEINTKLSGHTTFQTGGVVPLLFSPNSIESLQEVLNANTEYKVFILGNGSNLIFSDEMQQLLVIKLNLLNAYKIDKDGVLTAQAGCLMPKLALETVKLGYSGIDFAAGIPGTIGGCVFMNAGAYGVETSNHLIKVKVLKDNQVVEMSKSQIEFSYRHSSFKESDEIILEASFQLEIADKDYLDKLYYERMGKRKLTQPIGEKSAGSVFRNFSDKGAWEVVDQVNLRGFKIGGAMFSDKHCNTIINYDNATSKDIKELITLAQTKAKNELDIDLILEQIIIE